MKILVAGDLVINKTYDSLNINSSLIDLFNSSDLNIVNLEAPITTSNTKILKTGPHLKANHKSTLEVLKALRVDAVTLANNHLLDYDETGVKDTLSFCRNSDIQPIGAGMNLDEASKINYIKTKEGKIAIVNFAENEWASATKDTAGSNPMNLIDNARQIKEAKKHADFVFVIIHGGHEYYNLPSPRIQKQYRFYAEQGADIIIGHHTHCISGYEVYNNVPIYYSLGNFLFTNNSIYNDWYTGLILEIKIINGVLTTYLHPIKQEKETFKLNFHSQKNIIIDRILSYNEIISDSDKLLAEWNNYIKSKYKPYLNMWSPISFVQNRYLKGIFNKLGINFINKKGISLALNLMRCEAHLDMSKAVSKKYLQK